MILFPLSAADGVWIELTYSDGAPYGHHCNGAKRSARLIFLCDPLINGLVGEPIVTLSVCGDNQYCREILTSWRRAEIQIYASIRLVWQPRVCVGLS